MKIRKKLTVMAVMIAMLVAVIPVIPATVAKADSISDATYYTLGTTQNGVLTENGGEDRYYRFSLPTSGSIHLTGSAYMDTVDLYFYDENAKELWHEYFNWNSTSEVITIDNTKYLASGTYYFRVGHWRCTGNFNFNIDFTSSNESFTEGNGGSNNTIASANTVSIDGTSYNAQLALNDEKDFWKFTLNESGCVKFKSTFYNVQKVYWKLFDENGEELISKNPEWNNTTTNIVVDENLELTKGTYYLCVSLDWVYYGRYSFSLPFTSSKETYTETYGGTNNITETASALTVGKSYKGQIAINDDKDFYQFTLSSARSVVVKAESTMERLWIILYDDNGEELWSDCPYRNSTTHRIAYSRITSLEKGTYYIAAVKRDGHCGDYTLKVEKLTKSTCPHEEYDSYWVDATYFSKGYRKYVCKACGHSYKADYEAVKKLSQPYFYTGSSYSVKGGAHFSWSFVYDASGYQIRYSRNSKFKSGVVTKTIKGDVTSKTIKKMARKKKYYAQVRAYVKSGSKTAYSSWSSKVYFRTK